MPEFSRDAMMMNNWTQGLVLPKASFTISLSDIDSLQREDTYDFLVLFTQDCDLVNPSLEKEPFAEFFYAQRVSKTAKQYAYGKHPRIIHLATIGGVCVEVHINRRIRVDRSILASHFVAVDCDRLDSENLFLLLDWLSKKYMRPAFPDAFNDIVASIHNLNGKLRKFDETFPDVIRIFFRLSPENSELLNIPYEMDIRLLLFGLSGADNDEDYKEKVRERFLRVFSHAMLTINSCECLYENEMLLYELRIFKVWDKDFITLRRQYS